MVTSYPLSMTFMYSCFHNHIVCRGKQNWISLGWIHDRQIRGDWDNSYHLRYTAPAAGVSEWVLGFNVLLNFPIIRQRRIPKSIGNVPPCRRVDFHRSFNFHASPKQIPEGKQGHVNLSKEHNPTTWNGPSEHQYYTPACEFLFIGLLIWF